MFLTACHQNQPGEEASNPAAEGFNLEGSDSLAVAIADRVMDAMGGRAKWDSVQTIKWTFFGRRDHIWDKLEKRSEINIPSDSTQIKINLETKEGQLIKAGVIESNPDSIQKYVEAGYRMWINDSYWLVMPFKLKDSGVTLKYVGQDTTLTGESANVLELTFSDVGVTPENKYHVYVDAYSSLVTQWDYFTNYNDTIPRFQSPWPSYESYEGLLLSGGEINGRGMTEISVKLKE